MNRFKHNIFGAIKTEVDGIKFQSKREAYYYQLYKALQKQGKIKNLKLQTKIDFNINNKKMFTYRPDFEFDDNNGHHYIDVKGVETPLFKLKKKIIEAFYDIKIEIMR